MYDDRCDACECDEWVFMRAVDRDDASNDCKATPCEFGVCPEIDTVTSDCK